MQICAELRNKHTEINDENCIVADIIELPESEYASLYQNLLRERGYFTERAKMEPFIDGQRSCILVLGEGQQDGILVDSQGSSYARRSAFIPGARTLVQNHIRQLADYVVSESTEHTEDGKWSVSYDELYYHFGAQINDTNGNGRLLREELQQREEINELIMTEDCIEMTYHMEFCENCQEGGIKGAMSLFSLMGCNLYDVHLCHSDEDHELATVVELNQDTLTEDGRREWSDVLSARVTSIYAGSYGVQIGLTGCPAERLRDFSFMLAGHCSEKDYDQWVKQDGNTDQEQDEEPMQTM